MTIGFLRLGSEDRARVAHLVPEPQEAVFTAVPAERLRVLGPGETGWAVTVGEDIVGFFVLDRDFAATHDFALPGEVGLRSLLIDPARRGKGLGQAVMLGLPQLVAQEFPGAAGVVLTCNFRNTVAYRTYIRSGFVDTGEVDHGGSAGPQHAMRLGASLSGPRRPATEPGETG